MSYGSYSFLDVTATVTGPGINIQITGAAEEGVSVEREGDQNTLVVGAGGDGMMSLSARRSGTVTFNLLKTSPCNQQLQNGYDFQTTTSANNGPNTIVVRDPVRGDLVTATGCAYRRFPNLAYAAQGNTQPWTFLATQIVSKLGPGVGG